MTVFPKSRLFPQPARSCRSVGVRFGSARCAEVSRRGRQHCAWRNKADWLRKFNTERVDGVLLVTGADLLSVTFQSNELLGILAGSIKVVYSEVGQTRPGAQRGHEHFGFLDGVSQPGIRGLTTAEAWRNHDQRATSWSLRSIRRNRST